MVLHIPVTFGRSNPFVSESVTICTNWLSAVQAGESTEASQDQGQTGSALEAIQVSVCNKIIRISTLKQVLEECPAAAILRVSGNSF